nr:carboxypeptidase regulatory-like domain-containing protein [Acidobacteriota bacterium]
LDGFVKDPSGASVQSAKIIAVNLATNQVHETTADGAGYFRFSLLQVVPWIGDS